MKIRAPYNFVPLSGWIYEPDWGCKVSQDLPFGDGLSGTLALTITAETPILVGGEQEKDGESGNDDPGRTQVHFFTCPDGNPGIPGSSLKGMIRNLLEIAAFGKMRMVDDRWLSIRDLTATLKDVYRKHLTQDDPQTNTVTALSKAGWLQFVGDEDAHWQIAPCDCARVEQDDLQAFQHGVDLKSAQRAVDKYRQWNGKPTRLKVSFDLEKDHPHPLRNTRGNKTLLYDKASNLGSGTEHGRLVFTGQPAPNDGRRGRKHMEFVFYNKKPPLRLEDEVMRAFQHTHADNEDWLEHWQPEVHQGRRIPVFYLEDQGRITTLGLAMMFRLPYKHRIGQLIAHSHPAHNQAVPGDRFYDLPELLFGTLHDEDQEDARPSLKGRVSFGLARLVNDKKPSALPATILSTPKPSYFPNYVKQPGGGLLHGELMEKQQYKTYMDDNAEIRGWKRYPARPAWGIQELTAEQRKKPKVQVQLHPLPEGACFEGRVRFHNLRPEELGALLWAISWGGNRRLRHSLGMGKPFGLGQVRLEYKVEDLRSVAPTGSPLTPEACMARFEACMDAAFTKAQARSDGQPPIAWKDSEQLCQLLAMADPLQVLDRDLTYMHLPIQPGENEPQTNEFAKAKEQKLALKEYAHCQSMRDHRDHRLFPRGVADRGDVAAGNPDDRAALWLDEALTHFGITTSQLAERWQALPEDDFKRLVLDRIISRWPISWDFPPSGKSTIKARKIYDNWLKDHSQETQ